MKKEIEVKFDDLEWLYSPNWEYFDYGNCKRHLQVIIRKMIILVPEISSNII